MVPGQVSPVWVEEEESCGWLKSYYALVPLNDSRTRMLCEIDVQTSCALKTVMWFWIFVLYSYVPCCHRSPSGEEHGKVKMVDVNAVETTEQVLPQESGVEYGQASGGACDEESEETSGGESEEAFVEAQKKGFPWVCEGAFEEACQQVYKWDSGVALMGMALDQLGIEE